MKGYKGFDKDLKCNGYQYEIGKTFEMDVNKKLKCCPEYLDTEAGLHFCINPLNVLNYYGNVDGNRYAIVESVGDVSTHPSDTKVATNKLKVIKEITYDELLQHGIEYSIKNTINFEIDDNVFEKCPESLKSKYILSRFEKGLYLSDEMFKWCSYGLKEKYISMCIENDYVISNEQFELCSNELKQKYILNCIENDYVISDKKFEWCRDELKEKYISMCIENNYVISDKKFE